MVAEAIAALFCMHYEGSVWANPLHYILAMVVRSVADSLAAGSNAVPMKPKFIQSKFCQMVARAAQIQRDKREQMGQKGHLKKKTNLVAIVKEEHGKAKASLGKIETSFPSDWGSAAYPIGAPCPIGAPATSLALCLETAYLNAYPDVCFLGIK